MVSIAAAQAQTSGGAPPGTPPLHKLFAGIVKGVLSGDTLILMRGGPSRGGPPPEVRVSLACIRAPLLAGREGTDEPHAWGARESLRKSLIGIQVNFRVEYIAAGRVFASVYKDGKNIAIEHVAMGRAKVNIRSESQTCPEIEDILDAEKRAESGRVGLHGAAPLASEGRRIGDTMSSDYIASMCEGQNMRGIVEHVLNGSALKVLLRDVKSDTGTTTDQNVTVCLSGVQCPGFRREAEGAEPKAMPFALNAKYLTEIRLLHRDVLVRVEGVDRNGMLFATVTIPGSSTYIGEELLRTGFAKTVSWSIELSSMAPALRAAERSARDRRAGVWKDFVAPAKGSEDAFTGKCIEVVSGDTLVVLLQSGETRRITLASVRIPRGEKMNTRDRSIIMTGPSVEGKEALRKKVIGRMLDVKVEYKRAPAEGSVRRDPMVFATVGRTGDAKNKDIALPLISDGFLSVTRHRGDEDRAENYEEYLEREKAAIEAKRGMHKENVDSSSIRVNNLTGPDAKKRSRDVLAGLQRNGPHEGIVEYVSNASRFRVFLPKQSMLITLALRAVRCPQSTRRIFNPDGTIREETKGDPHGDEAAMYAREHFMQRQVEIDVAAVDRVGAFLGNMCLTTRSGAGQTKREDVSLALLELGHGYLHEAFPVDREPSASRYVAAQNAAKEAKRGLWKDWVEPEPEQSTSSATGGPVRTFSARVAEIGFGGRIFVQPAETAEADLAGIAAGLASLNLDSMAPAAGASAFRAGQVVAAKFSADGAWYRARILVITPQGEFRVRFVDYGNEDLVRAADIRRLDMIAGFVSKRPVAVEILLKDIVVPDADDPSGQAAGAFLRDLMFNGDVTVAVYSTDPGGVLRGDILLPAAKAAAVAGAAASATTTSKPRSVVEELLKNGLARITRKSDRGMKETFKKLRPFEEIGIATRQYLWHYGDVYESDCDDEPEVQDRNRSRRGGP